ncbi:MAG: bifunctional glutamate N-acetyltransferase/amino-acid acetyltransferase ArgJ [Pseudothermotoga sp.]|uniref:Arginine biosynthesis bifunctional protein ArgJ n=1 Tax=Pseudothermotoga hypogea TaxID=57487 RepID=A0A832I7B2_9THEM|nr:bifunctional glutamate N-acetyltransferase/amino-acid acetyltransferase ArgJ [Pseudothermotoga sp.]
MELPKGFLFSGLNCGIKRYRKDLGIAYSIFDCVATGLFTTNTVKAAPILYNMNLLGENCTKIRAVVVNSKIANSCTGQQGLENAYRTAQKAAQVLQIDQRSVLLASTGIIGLQLPMDKIEAGIEEASKCLNEDPTPFAEAITTTDTFIKMSSRSFEIDGTKVNILGIAKGSGMIHPNMATMLAFIFTDANISPDALKKALKDSVEKSYNMIDVDGDTSTNDMVLALANGQAGNERIEEDSPEFSKFFENLHEINVELAKMIVKDGEGATKLIEVRVVHAPDELSARRIARSIVSSNLVKTAIHAQDPNWGRIVAAAGYSGVDFDPEKLDLHITDGKNMITVLKRGYPCEFNEDEVNSVLSASEIVLIVDLNEGVHSATAWGCDLSEEYIKKNGRYKAWAKTL